MPAYSPFGNLGALGGGARALPMPGYPSQPSPPPVRGGPVFPVGQNPNVGGMPPAPVHPAWGINPPQFGQAGANPMQQPNWGIPPPQQFNPAPVHPAWGFNPPHFGSGAAGLANHLASLRQMSNPMQYQHMMSPRFY